MDNRKWESGAAANVPVAPAVPSSGYPTDGDPLASVPPTVPGAYWFHQVGEELRAILTAAGIAPDSAALSQLLSALRSAGVFQTPAQFDNGTKASTTAFVQRALGNVRSMVGLSVNTTLTADDAGKMFSTPGGYTITLPAVASCPSGSSFHFSAVGNGGVTTIATSNSEQIAIGNGYAPTSVILKQGETITLTSNAGTAWYVTNRVAELDKLAVFASSLAASGYQKLPSGVIIQWGTWTASATPGNPVAVTFPLTFPTACDIVVPSAINASTTNSAAWYDTPATTGFNGRCAVASLACRYFAIGR